MITKKCDNLVAFFFLLLITFTATELDGQRSKIQTILSDNNVQVRKGFSIALDDDSDSTLITEEHFNLYGRETLHKNYHKSGSTSTYEYYYLYDTIRTSRNTILNDSFHSKSILSYDKKGRYVGSEDFDEQGNPTGTMETIKYKKGGRKIERKFYSDHKIISHTLEIYDKNMKITKFRRKYNGKWRTLAIPERFKKNGKTREFKNFQGLDQRMVRTVQIFRKPQKIIGSTEILDLKRGDELVTQRYFAKNGLIMKEVQILNDVTIGKKVYAYTFY